MKPLRPGPGRPHLAAMLLATLGLPVAAIANDTPAAVPQSSLHACAVIAAAPERLACYDRLSGRAVQNTAALPGTATPPAAAPAATARVAAPAATPPVASAPPAAPASLSKESFGLYAAEHPPAPPVAATLAARIIALGRSASGRPTVALEGGQLWEVDAADPLLAVGDTVTVRRAALGSFMMVTPAQRTHRVRRLR
jgi:hypothetical protein